MNNTVLAGLIVGAVVVSAAGALAFNSGFNPLQKYATVVSVEPAFETNRIPRQVCGDEATLAQLTASAEVPIASAPAGTTADSVGSSADTRAQKAAPKAAPKGKVEEAAAEEKCMTVFDTESIQSGFDVTYELDGVQKVVRMDQDPGERIPVEDGELILSQS